MTVEWCVSRREPVEPQVMSCTSAADAERVVRESGAPDGTWYYMSSWADHRRRTVVSGRLGGSPAIFDYE